MPTAIWETLISPPRASWVISWHVPLLQISKYHVCAARLREDGSYYSHNCTSLFNKLKKQLPHHRSLLPRTYFHTWISIHMVSFATPCMLLYTSKDIFLGQLCPTRRGARGTGWVRTPCLGGSATAAPPGAPETRTPPILPLHRLVSTWREAHALRHV